MGHTEVVSEMAEVGEMEDMAAACAREEWQEGVLSAESPAERAMWRRGTEGRESSVLWVCMKRLERSVQRSWL